MIYPISIVLAQKNELLAAAKRGKSSRHFLPKWSHSQLVEILVLGNIQKILLLLNYLLILSHRSRHTVLRDVETKIWRGGKMAANKQKN